jgi:hypothetical protein
MPNYLQCFEAPFLSDAQPRRPSHVAKLACSAGGGKAPTMPDYGRRVMPGWMVPSRRRGWPQRCAAARACEWRSGSAFIWRRGRAFWRRALKEPATRRPAGRQGWRNQAFKLGSCSPWALTARETCGPLRTLPCRLRSALPGSSSAPAATCRCSCAASATADSSTAAGNAPARRDTSAAARRPSGTSAARADGSSTPSARSAGVPVNRLRQCPSPTSLRTKTPAP